MTQKELKQIATEVQEIIENPNAPYLLKAEISNLVSIYFYKKLKEI